MDWTDSLVRVLASVVTVGAVAGAIRYAIKRGFDARVDLQQQTKLARIEAAIAEETRRNAAFFDRRSEALQRIVSLVHRLRHLARELAAHPVTDAATDELWVEYESKFRLLADTISDNRVLLHEDHIRIMHDLRAFQSIVGGWRALAAEASLPEQTSTRVADSICQAQTRVDEGFQHLLSLVQNEIAVHSHRDSA